MRRATPQQTNKSLRDQANARRQPHPLTSKRERFPSRQSAQAGTSVKIENAATASLACGPIPLLSASPPAAAAVHIDRVRGHERAGVRAHEQHQFADLLRLAETLHRHVFEEALDELGRGLRGGLTRPMDR